MIQYRISYNNPLTFFLQVETSITGVTASETYLQLPAWRPGRYELQNFAAKIRGFRVTDLAGNQVAYDKITKDRWLIHSGNQSEIIVRYEFYAHQMDAGGSWVDETQLYLNPANCCMAVEGRENEPRELALAIPENWQIACGMEQINQNTLLAQNFEELVDCPLIASPTLQHEIYTVNNIPFHVWIQGNARINWERLLAEFTAFTEENLRVFHDFPVQDYHFLIQLLPFKHYHGVEHSNSTVIVLGPSENINDWGTYKELLGVSCHELFHTWNIKKIRPVEMMPYDYRQENYFKTGFVAEGLTTYYGDYLLARSRVFNAQQYFEELNGVLRKHYDEFGRNYYSVADSSFDLWLDGYKTITPDRKVSIYHKGALAALILDLELRRISGNQKSLDDVMRALWINFGKTGRGYTEQDYITIVNELAGVSFQAYFDRFIYGIEPMEAAIDEALRFVGCRLNETKSGLGYENKFGFKAGLKKNEIMNVGAIAPGSPAELVLTSDDDVIAVNGRRVENNLDKLMEQGDAFELTIFRNNYVRTVQIQADGRRYFQKYSVVKREDATEAERENFRLWLNQEF